MRDLRHPGEYAESWQHRGHIPAPEQPGRYNAAEAMVLAVMAELLRDGLVLELARGRAVTIAMMLGKFEMAMRTPPLVEEVRRLVFVRAVLPPQSAEAEFEDIERMITSSDDLGRLMTFLLRRQAVQIELRDVGLTFVRVREAFQRARVEPRERVMA